jgi:mono/diheme cytochrome c family protein
MPVSTALRRLQVAAAIGAVATLLGGCFTDRQNEGKRLYEQRCANCHGTNGEGLRRMIPPLVNADYMTKYRAKLPCLIQHGQQGPMVVNGIEYNQVMPAQHDLDEGQITNLLNYVQSSWGNKPQPFTINEVIELLKPCYGIDGQQ